MLNIRGRLIEFDRPAVMAIINVTPDSFYSGSRFNEADQIKNHACRAIADGADIIDLGAYSSRPGADDVTADEELRRLEFGMKAIRAVSADIPVSVDTFRADVARKCIEDFGADIINDISGGELDPQMFETVAELHAPYILMHMSGTPATMQSMTDYPEGVTAAVLNFLAEKVTRLHLLGVNDIIVDPGFGFGKTLQQNYQLLHELPALQILGHPILVGLSRKSMATRLLNITTEEALPATVALNTLALCGGASILRVHDVKEATQTVKLYSASC